MKQVNIRLEESLIKKAKHRALENDCSFQEVLTQALNLYLGVAPQSTVKNQDGTNIEIPLVPAQIEEPVKPPVQTRIVPSFDNIMPEKPTYTSRTLDDLLNEEPDPMDERYFYVLRKTAKLGKRISGSHQYNTGGIFWMILDGCRAHFDADGNLIPFRFTDADGKVWEPDEDEIKELEEYYGKPVTIEK
jgi:hypothetical protein